MNDASESSSWTLIHLSDLHLTTKSYAEEVKAKTDDGHRRSHYEVLRSLLSDASFQNAVAADAAIVSGDVTTKGDPLGFALFADQIVPELERALKPGLGRNAVCVVPGNHDVTWRLDPSTPEYFLRKFLGFRQMVDAARVTSSFIPNGGASGEPAYPDGQVATYVNQARRLVVLCVNSSLRCGEVDLDDPADASARARDVSHVTPKQREKLRGELARARAQIGGDWHRSLRVAVLHHHLVPFDGQVEEHKAFENVLDASLVLSLLSEHGVDLVLSGHKHQAYAQTYETKRSRMLVVGGGTACGEPGVSDAAGVSRVVRLLRVTRRRGVFECDVHDVPIVEGKSSASAIEQPDAWRRVGWFGQPNWTMSDRVQDLFFRQFTGREMPRVTFTQQIPLFFVNGLCDIAEQPYLDEHGPEACYALGMYYLALSPDDPRLATLAEQMFMKASSGLAYWQSRDRRPMDVLRRKTLVRLSQAHRQHAHHLRGDGAAGRRRVALASAVEIASKLASDDGHRNRVVAAFISGVTRLQAGLAERKQDARRGEFSEAAALFTRVYRAEFGDTPVPVKALLGTEADEKGSLAFYTAKALWCHRTAGGEVDDAFLGEALDTALAYYQHRLMQLGEAEMHADTRVTAIYIHCVALLLVVRHRLSDGGGRPLALDSAVAELLWPGKRRRLSQSSFWKEQFEALVSRSNDYIELLYRERSKGLPPLGIYSELDECLAPQQNFDNGHRELVRWWRDADSFRSAWGGT